jgi:hypothetical protein
MNQLTICRKLSLIHAVKCNKAVSFEIAQQSNNELIEFFNRLTSISDEEHQTFNQDVKSWMNTHPIVTDQNIQDILKK